MKKVLLFILFLLILVAGFKFRNNIFSFYNNFNNGIYDFKNLDIGSTLSQVGKEIFTPSPLNIGGVDKKVILLKSKIIEETNLQRSENANLIALTENEKLNDAALAKANDMFTKQYFEHISPDNIDPGKLVQNSGYDFIVAGENLILGNFASEKELVQAWMDSPGHRANILNNRYLEIGVAIIKGTYKGESVWIGVQEFGLPLSYCAEPNPSLKNQIESEKSQVEYLSTQINERKNQINNTNPMSVAYRKMIDDYNQLISQYNAMVQQVKDSIDRYNDQVNSFNNCVTGK